MLNPLCYRKKLQHSPRTLSLLLLRMVFHIGPTVLEVGLVTGLMAYQFGPYHSAVVLTTIGGYLGFTMAVSSWRTKFRREMNRLENQASGRVVDSLLNYETVKYFNNAKYEGDRYEASLRGYQKVRAVELFCSVHCFWCEMCCFHLSFSVSL